MRKLSLFLVVIFTISLFSLPAALAGDDDKILGVQVEAISVKDARKLGLDEPYGLKVLDLMPKGPAEKAGIKKGDVLLTIAGVKLKNTDVLDKMIAKSGWKMDIMVMRDGWEKKFTVKFPKPKAEPKSDNDATPDSDELKELKKSLRAIEKEAARLRRLIEKLEGKKTSKDPTGKGEKPRVQPKRSKGTPFIGISLEVTESGEVGITSVQEGSGADKAGLKPGDVVLKVDGKDLDSLDVLRTSVQRAGVGGTITLTVKRGDATREIEVTLTKRED